MVTERKGRSQMTDLENQICIFQQLFFDEQGLGFNDLEELAWGED